MGCAKGLARLILVIINTVFLLLGLGLLVVGCIAKWGSSLITKHIQPLINKASSGGSGDVNLATLFDGIAVGLIVLGVIIFVIGFLGCAGACCENKVMILLYGILVLLIIIGEIVCISITAAKRGEVEAKLKDVLKKSIKDDYTGSNAKSDAVGASWNYIFVELKCCGVDGYSDTHNGAWNRTANGVTFEAPLACCKDITGTFPDYKFPTSVVCATKPDDTNSNKNNGCYNAMLKTLTDQTTIIIAVAVSVAVVEIGCMIAAFCLFSAWKNEGVM